MAGAGADADAVLRAELARRGVSDLRALGPGVLVELALRYAIWLPVGTYTRAPWLAPFAVRRVRARTDPRAPGPKRDLWGMPDEQGYFTDDNSLIKGVVKNLPVSPPGPYGSAVIARGLVCCHVWPGTTTSPLLFSFVPNLVWLPKSLAGYSDAHLDGPPHEVHEVLKAVSVHRYRDRRPTVGGSRAEAAWRLMPTPAYRAVAAGAEFVAGDRVRSLALARTVRMIEFLEATLTSERLPRRFSRRYHAGVGPRIDGSVWPVQQAVSAAARARLLEDLRSSIAPSSDDLPPPPPPRPVPSEAPSPSPPLAPAQHEEIPQVPTAPDAFGEALAVGAGLGQVSEAELAEFGRWLVATRGLQPRPVSDYQSRVRRLARGVDVSSLTPGAQANLRTALRAFAEFRG